MSNKQILYTVDSAIPLTPINTARRDAIPSPKNGSLVLNSDTNTIQKYNGTSWENLMTSYKKYYIAAANSSADDKAKAQYIIGGGNTNTDLQNLINTLQTGSPYGGGILEFAPGQYSGINLLFTGTGDYRHNQITIKGSGQGTTEFTSSATANTPVFKMTKAAVVKFEDFSIKLQNSNVAFASTKATTIVDPTDYRGFWNSSFKNIYIEAIGSHTGFAMTLGSPFRSVFDNIDILGTRSGIRMYSEDNAFNPGDCTFNRIFHDPGSNGTSATVGYEIESTTTNGFMNHLRFILCESIGYLTNGGTGIKLFGTSGVHNCTFTDINLEDYAITLDLQNGTSNVFEFNYCNVISGGTYFKFGANAQSNIIRKSKLGIYGVPSTAINDANTDTTSPNVIENIRMEVETGGSALASGAGITGNVTKIYKRSGYNAGGTIATQLSLGGGY